MQHRASARTRAGWVMAVQREQSTGKPMRLGRRVADLYLRCWPCLTTARALQERLGVRQRAASCWLLWLQAQPWNGKQLQCVLVLSAS